MKELFSYEIVSEVVKPVGNDFIVHDNASFLVTEDPKRYPDLNKEGFLFVPQEAIDAYVDYGYEEQFKALLG